MNQPQPEGPPTGQDRVKARFWSKVDKEGGATACWAWKGSLRGKKNDERRKGAYGGFDVGGRTVLAHRFALETTLGRSLPSSVLVLHSCDNPQCVNPAHLSAGGHAQNLREAYARGRRRAVNQHTKRMQTRQVETIDAAA